MIPASPWIGSISTAQVFSPTAAASEPMSPKSKWTKPGANGPKSARYAASVEKPTIVVERPWKLPRATAIVARSGAMPLTRYPQRRAALIAVSTDSAPPLAGSARSSPATAVSFSRNGASASL